MDKSCWWRHMEAYVVTTMVQEHLPAKLFGKVSSGRQSSMYQFVDDILYRRRFNGVKL